MPFNSTIYLGEKFLPTSGQQFHRMRESRFIEWPNQLSFYIEILIQSVELTITVASFALTLSIRCTWLLSISSVRVLLVAMRVAKLFSFDGVTAVEEDCVTSVVWLSRCCFRIKSSWATEVSKMHNCVIDLPESGIPYIFIQLCAMMSGCISVIGTFLHTSIRIWLCG